ncbi:MAG TPA: MFS transporter [Dictyobacter sp.]|jgi:EmrB/QacA subfamily drug resistance transporter|nr:MFS transporter [Dictyobacter sp.]
MQKSVTTSPELTVRGKPVRPWLVLISVIFGFFMALLDATIVNIAIPTIQTDLKSDLTTVSWVLDAYNLVFAVLLVTVGRFADQYGRKRLFMIGMVVFSIGSLLCALSQTIGAATGIPGINWLIGFRAFQAIGAAGLNPISLAIIMSVFPREKRGAAIGVWGALSGLAAAAGPVIGGFLVENLDWRYIFFVNLPFCVVGLIMVALFVPETRDMRVSKHIDIPGIVTLSVGIFCLVLAIIEGNDWGWTSLLTLGLFVVTVILLIVFALVERKQLEPIIDFSLFKAASFTGANVTIFLFGIASQGAFLMLTLYFIDARGYDEIHAAYAVLPIPLASFVVSAIAGRFSGKLNPHIMGLLGMILIVVSFILLCFMGADAAYVDIAWRSVFFGVGMGLLFQSQPTIALSEVPPSKYGVGSGVFNTFRQVGFTLGIAVLISVFTARITPNLQQAVNTSVAQVQASSQLPPQMKSGIVSGLQQAVQNSTVSEAGSSGSSSTNFDLTKLAAQLPPQTPAPEKTAITNTLSSLNGVINNAFMIQVVATFKSTWWVSAGLSLLGVISALVAFIVHRPRAKVQGQQEDNAAEIAHASLG